MNITTLTLTSFRSFDGIELPLDAPRIYIAGQNGVGKSSVREAIRWILTGKAQGLDARGSGVEKLIPTMNGHKTVAASVTIPSIGVIERTWSASGSSLRVQGWTGTTQSQQEALYAKLETSEPFLHAILDSSTFLALHHGEAKGLVLALLNVRIKIGEAVDAPVYTLSELDEAYDQAFEDRKIAKVKVRSAVVPPKPADQALPEKTAVEARLTTLKAERDVALRHLGTAWERSRLEKMIRESEALVDPDDATMNALADEIETLSERLALMDENPVTSAEPLIVIRNRTEALLKHRPLEGCVLDPDVPCKTPKVNFTKRAKVLQVELTSAPSGETQPSAAKQVHDQLRALERRQTEIQTTIQTNAMRRNHAAEIKKELSALGDTFSQEATVADLTTRIQKGEGVLAAVNAYEKAVQAHETGLQAQQTLQGEVDRLEELCSVLGPSGVRVQALQSALGTFETAINTFLAPWRFVVGFTLEPWQVQVNGRAVETYSRSEQYRIGIAIQLAVALLSGLKFAVVDELDLLDQANRDQMGALLYLAPLDQILILGTRELGHPLPAAPRMVSYRLAGGGSVQPAERTTVVERA